MSALHRLGAYLMVLATALATSALTGCAATSGADRQQTAPSTVNDARRPRPNVLLIVADDLGYSDLGAYGSEIHTPRLDALAARGRLYTDFLAAPTCSTSRSMLLSGVDSHRNGLGALDESGRPVTGGKPGYEGYLNFRVTTIASVLQGAGYNTLMAGKWHLGGSAEALPQSRGFAQSFVLPGGAAAHFGNRGATSPSPIATYLENGKRVTLPEHAYSTTYITDRLIGYIDAASGNGSPFFAYAAYTAPHWPLQAPEAFLKRQAGRYDRGYEEVRRERVNRMRKAGVLGSGSPANLPGPVSRSWSSLDPLTRAREAKRMEVYAAMVESLDHEIGRLLDHLDSKDMLENTLIVFLSDNGPEGNDPYQIAQNGSWVPKTFKTDTASMGGPDSFVTYGPGWAEVSASPFRLFKSFTGEGGNRVPAILVEPGQRKSRIERAPSSVLDIFPTVLEVTGTTYPQHAPDGDAIEPLAGLSLLGDKARAPRPLGWELFGRRAVRHGDWKLHWADKPYGTGDWQLYRLDTDPGETRDLARSNPRQLARLLALWESYRRDNNVELRNYDDLRYGKINRHYDR